MDSIRLLLSTAIAFLFLFYPIINNILDLKNGTYLAQALVELKLGGGMFGMILSLFLLFQYKRKVQITNEFKELEFRIYFTDVNLQKSIEKIKMNESNVTFKEWILYSHEKFRVDLLNHLSNMELLTSNKSRIQTTQRVKRQLKLVKKNIAKLNKMPFLVDVKLEKQLLEKVDIKCSSALIGCDKFLDKNKSFSDLLIYLRSLSSQDI